MAREEWGGRKVKQVTADIPKNTKPGKNKIKTAGHERREQCRTWPGFTQIEQAQVLKPHLKT